MELKQRTNSKPEIEEDDLFEDEELDNNLPAKPGEEIKDDILDDGPADMGDEFYGDTSQTNMQKYNDMLKDLTGLNPILMDKAKGWLGLYWSEEKQAFIPNTKTPPLMNEDGVNWCITYIKNYVAKHHFLTNINADEWKWTYLDVTKVIFTDFAVLDGFGITNESNRHRICIEMRDAIMLFITGAGSGKYTQFFGSATMRHESVNLSQNGQMNPQMPMYQPPKKGGLLGMARKMLTGGQ